MKFGFGIILTLDLKINMPKLSIRNFSIFSFQIFSRADDNSCRSWVCYEAHRIGCPNKYLENCDTK